MKNLTKLFYILGFFFLTTAYSFSAEKVDYLKTDWSFKGLFGKFDRGSLQRGYQVYTEVCAACHSMKYLSYRNLGEKGGPEFSEAETKAIAASFEVLDGPTGFMVITREAFDKMHEHYKEELDCINDHQNRDFEKYCALFDCMIDPDNRRYLSEDYAFCRRWQQMGGKIYADCNTTLGHIGNLPFSGCLKDRLKV